MKRKGTRSKTSNRQIFIKIDERRIKKTSQSERGERNGEGKNRFFDVEEDHAMEDSQ